MVLTQFECRAAAVKLYASHVAQLWNCVFYMHGQAVMSNFHILLMLAILLQVRSGRLQRAPDGVAD
jgi:hypothetical protein